ncbi:RluA family pseudouridine synthase [Roseobacter sp. HKCCD9010]|uniref:RluA family pseudouridine synthase n=1 Tax=unclassified Roseobacter TaxID=196798 RepID=UPI001491FD4E|nr:MULTISPECIES: RluA family pseudouridine synthase [unclassified Roseobacter]MBF9051669.1 RluA family pseudouridine synthase [Rhodobacterales bacterium HKCCD4356]NNV13193.1 RluA family pseudouridine synthase [Roseobacter sp. HKCCD7357]NNV17444.1 RluA family pseudouridine synthase [Roseobacter sp. HKCCD8768]NNV27050.1 RluA family pseudouridine synthase [Roseobacter sp. HKCCD8192]NNV31170.1 RluA family pseudouridine synthase [Roseobacter sp. HKCCD9061]
MSGVQTLEVAPGDGDQRLDRWFRRQFPQISQGRIEKMCRKGEIRVDGGRVKPATRVEAGQKVRIPPLPDQAAPQPAVSRSKISDADAEMMRAAVLYRDDHLIALNKPPGLPSQGGSKQTRHVDWLAEALLFGFEDKPRLVHRLDKDTSGILLLARTRQAAAALTKAFRARDTRKIYWAAVAGAPLPRMGTIKFGLVKAPGHGKGGEGEKMLCLHPDEVDRTPDAKRATTDYAVLSNLGSRAAWVALVPVTGRTHQLRAHMAEIGHPVIGDGKYGGSGQENLGDGWGAQLGGEISRKLHLHARSLALTHPITGARLNLVAPLPEHMARTWETLGWYANDVPADPFDEDSF